jgi:2'-5' RNA ligase
MRAFIAVDAASSAIGKLQDEIMSVTGWSRRDVKPVEASSFHFTLIFLGEIRDSDVPMVKAKLSELEFQPFTVIYGNVGAFPNPNYARVVWLGVDPGGGQKLSALAGDVVAKMGELAFRADKPFSPHLTIFRAKSRPVRLSDMSVKYEGRTFGSDLVDKVHLKKSDMTPSGAIYSNIYTVEGKN